MFYTINSLISVHHVFWKFSLVKVVTPKFDSLWSVSLFIYLLLFKEINTLSINAALK